MLASQWHNDEQRIYNRSFEYRANYVFNYIFYLLQETLLVYSR